MCNSGARYGYTQARIKLVSMNTWSKNLDFDCIRKAFVAVVLCVRGSDMNLFARFKISHDSVSRIWFTMP